MEIRPYKLDTIKDSEPTLHMSRDRLERVDLALHLMRTDTNCQIIGTFLVNKGHKDGAEVHIVYNNAIIVIFNAITKRFITVLFARRGQIDRYFKNSDNSAVYPYCDRNVNNGWNKM